MKSVLYICNEYWEEFRGQSMIFVVSTGAIGAVILLVLTTKVVEAYWLRREKDYAAQLSDRNIHPYGFMSGQFLGVILMVTARGCSSIYNFGIGLRNWMTQNQR